MRPIHANLIAILALGLIAWPAWRYYRAPSDHDLVRHAHRVADTRTWLSDYYVWTSNDTITCFLNAETEQAGTIRGSELCGLRLDSRTGSQTEFTVPVPLPHGLPGEEMQPGANMAISPDGLHAAWARSDGSRTELMTSDLQGRVEGRWTSGVPAAGATWNFEHAAFNVRLTPEHDGRHWLFQVGEGDDRDTFLRFGGAGQPQKVSWVTARLNTSSGSTQRVPGSLHVRSPEDVALASASWEEHDGSHDGYVRFLAPGSDVLAARAAVVHFPVPGRVACAVFSPSNRKVAWILQEWSASSGNPDSTVRPPTPRNWLWISSADGRHLTLLGEAPPARLASRPHGKAGLFAHQSVGPHSLQFSPDERTLAFIYADKLYTIPAP